MQRTTGNAHIFRMRHGFVSQSSTAKLWFENLVKPVIMMMMIFVPAEQGGDWHLYLCAVREMLPYFFAAGDYEAT